MKILICGDVVCRPGREAIEKYLPALKKKYEIDFIVLNVDNAAHGFGVNPSIADQFLNMGVDALTGGNHMFDQKDIIPFIDKEKRLLRPYNMPKITPGIGCCVYEAKNSGKKVVVLHLLGQKNMPIIGGDPFEAATAALSKYKMGENVAAIIVDFHADVTSEKNALGVHLDGQVSVVVGTHTHIPTSDTRILEKGTAFQTDIGMTGDYDSVIGMHKYAALDRFVKGYNSSKLSSATGEGTLSGLLVETDDKTGLAKKVQPVLLGGRLSPDYIKLVD